MKYIRQNIIMIPNTETIDTPYLGTLDPGPGLMVVVLQAPFENEGKRRAEPEGAGTADSPCALLYLDTM